MSCIFTANSSRSMGAAPRITRLRSARVTGLATPSPANHWARASSTAVLTAAKSAPARGRTLADTFTGRGVAAATVTVTPISRRAWRSASNSSSTAAEGAAPSPQAKTATVPAPLARGTTWTVVMPGTARAADS